MSYRGRPSKGCEPCRARKVKCDEGKPICSRCRKSGHDCQYRDQADLLFRNQTASAAQRAEDSWRKRSKSNQRAREHSSSITPPPSDEPSPPAVTCYQQTPGTQADRLSPPRGTADYNIHDVFDGASPLPELGSMALSPGKKQDLRRRAFDRFLYDFVIHDPPDMPPNTQSDALFTFIPELYNNAPESSCIAKVVDAVSYVNLANRCGATEAEALAEECISQGIALLSRMIADKKMAASNEALCAVYMMGVYENLTTLQRKGTFIAHHQGANALLQLRSLEEYYQDSMSARLYEVAYAQMLLGNIQSAKAPPIPVRDVVNVENFLPDLYSNSHVFVVRLIWREAMLHARWHEIKQSAIPPTGRRALQELLQTALALDGEFQAWEAMTPPTWKYEKQMNTPEVQRNYDVKWQDLLLNCKGAPNEVHAYPTLKRVWIWGFYRTTRVFLLRDILEIINWMFRLPEIESPILRVGVKQEMDSTSIKQEDELPARLDDMALCIYRSLATDHLVELIEACCSAVIGSFMVKDPSKSLTDVVGMKGYIVLWALGNIDAVLQSGLVPDAKAPGVNASSEEARSRPSRNSDFTTPEPEDKLASYDAAPQFSELSKLSPKTENDHVHQGSRSPESVIHSATTPILTAKRGHIFDSSPARPFDQPVDSPPYNISGVEPRRIDVTARREWLNRVLYYIGTETGVKKALYVPLTEGYMPKVKPVVDALLGR